MKQSLAITALLGVALLAGCGSKAPGSGGTAGTSGAGGSGGSVSDAATEAAAGSGAAGSHADAGVDTSSEHAQDGAADVPPGGCVAPTTRGTCTPPANMYCPVPKLSLSGCMDATNPTQLAPNVIPYEVNSPLWSDSAYKARGFVLPAGGKIHVKDCVANPSECKRGPADTGKWVLPVGSVMVKSFMFGNKLVETRLLVHPDAYNWYGYTYQWNEAQTEATIVPDARAEATFNVGADAGVSGADGGVVDWHYPSRTDCGDCHTQPAGGTLGPETDQMNRTVGGMNQIDKWAAMNLFETPPAKPYPAPLMLPYSGQLGTADTTPATLDQRARSYLHVNCAHCHRPDADQNAFDLRFGVTLHDTMACDAPLTMTASDVPGAVVLAPGEPTKSAIWFRMNAPIGEDKNLHMPRIATYQFDTQGLKLVSDWITSIKTCP